MIKEAAELLEARASDIPMEVPRLETLVRLYMELKDKDKGIEAQESLLQLNSQNLYYYWNILEFHGFPKSAAPFSEA